MAHFSTKVKNIHKLSNARDSSTQWDELDSRVSPSPLPNPTCSRPPHRVHEDCLNCSQVPGLELMIFSLNAEELKRIGKIFLFD